MYWKIPLFKIYSDKEDIAAVTEVIKSGGDWAIGTNIEKLENALAKYVKVKYALVFNSGTSALHSLMIGCGIGSGDEVIVPSFTFIATANAPLFVGAKPIFADIEEETFGLDPKDVKKKITKKTKAIIPVHYGGCPCKIQELRRLASEYNLILIEDAAESLGAKVRNKKVGTFADAAMFSFCAPKVITSGEGGAVVSNSKVIYEKLKLIRSHGRVEDINYFSSIQYMDYIRLGYNFRMSNIIASLALSQLKKIDKVIEMRRKNAEYLTNKLLKMEKIVLPSCPKDYFHIYQMYTIKVKGGKKLRDSLRDYLNKKGIMAKVYFDPVHLTSFYKNLSYDIELPVTEKISRQVLTLPMYPMIKNKEIDYITENIKFFFG